MNKWTAKVHKTGSKVAVFNGAKCVKIVQASKETFEPAEAQKFAEELLTELVKQAEQMDTPADQPSVTTKAESQIADTAEVAKDPVGASPADMEIQDEEDGEPEPIDLDDDDELQDEEKPEPVATDDDEEVAKDEEKVGKLVARIHELKKVATILQKKLANEKEERVVERKARRGLAIAKQMVTAGTLDDTYDAIHKKVSEIVNLEVSEIERLEKKMAGEKEFDSVDAALKAARRYSRIGRLNRTAAAEAEEEGDSDQADELDIKAEEAEQKAAEINAIAKGMQEECACDEKQDEVTDENTVGVNAKGAATAKSAATDMVTPTVADEAVQDEEVKKDDDGDDDEDDDDVVEANKKAELAKKYRRIAAKHRKLAEAAEAAGDTDDADAQDDMADDAETKAETLEAQFEEKVVEPATESQQEENIEMQDEETEGEPEPIDLDDDDDKAVEESQDEEGVTEDGDTAKDDTDDDNEEGEEVVASKKASVLKRKDGTVVDGFGLDKNASIVEQNEYSHDPQVDALSAMWRGAPKDE